jgi:hypothetical protein
VNWTGATPGQTVRALLDGLGLARLEVAPDVSEEDWSTWLEHFCQSYGHNPKIEEFGACPQCGAPLRRRTGKYGPFLGCAGYPFCEYTRRIK